MSARAERRCSLAACGLLALALSCAVGPNYTRPPEPQLPGYAQRPLAPTVPVGGKSQTFAVSNEVKPDWWRLLRSPAIDALVEDALTRSPTLEAAQAALRRSEDSLRAGKGIFFPQADLAGGVSRQRYSPARVGSSLPGSVFNLFTLSGSINYPLDLWGGERRAVEALGAQAEGQRYALIGAYLVLSSNVVNTAIAAAAYRAEIEATRALVALEEDQVRLGQAQAEAGTVPYANVLSLQSQLATTRGLLAPLQQRLEQAESLLATLTGRFAGTWSAPAVTLSELTLPDQLPVSLPAALVRQRPDVLIAEAQLHANTAQIGVATAAMLPNITLTASYGVNNPSLTDLTAANSVFWSLLAGVTQPLFRGGMLYYQRKAAIDTRDQALANYRQTVLGAIEQVADSLGALGHDAEAVNAQSEALQSAADALRLIQINYQAGLATYLQVLTANEQYLQGNIGLIQSEAQRLQDTVALFVALGGGWWNARPAATPAAHTSASPAPSPAKKGSRLGPLHAAFVGL